MSTTFDESELTLANEEFHLNKNTFTVPIVCGCRDLGEASRRIAEDLPCFVQKVNQVENRMQERGW